MRTRVLVCGATGFIGRNIAEYLARRPEYEVVGVYHRRPPIDELNIQWVKGDLTSPGAVESVVRGADIIVQAAATTSGIKDITQRPHIHVTDNVVMNALLFRAAHDLEAKHVVYFSCAVMYQNSSTPLRETDFNPNDDLHPRYFGAGWTKLFGERMCDFYSRLGTTRYTAIRHSNIYGPHDKFDLERSHVFGATVTKVMTAQDGRIKVWGSGEEARDLLYVDDLVDFVQRAIDRQKTPFELLNCGCGKPVSVRNLVQKIVLASGHPLQIEYDMSQPTIATSVSLNCEKAERLLGWRPAIDLDAGITKTIAWWRATQGNAGR